MNESDPDEKIISIHYSFQFGNNRKEDFLIHLDSKTHNLIFEPRKNYPSWVKLSCNQCPHCTLNPSITPRCPVAESLIDFVGIFRDTLSYEEVDVIIETEPRTYSKHTSIQKGLSSLLGIFMVTAGCPIMDKLRPMVRYHLPFATMEETRYRALSMYMLAQFFRMQNNEKPDWNLDGLIKIYDDIRIVNQTFCKRLSNITIEDASLNAVVILNNFADFVPFTVSKHMLEEMGGIFRSYLKPEE